MRIKEIIKNSPAQRSGLREGDLLLTLNGKKVWDEIDLKFYAAEESLVVEIRRGDKVLTRKVRKSPDGDLGVRLGPIKIRRCGNKCIFCFVDQMPKGLRPSLYIKDEDYRLSFLHGNYLTLTNLSSIDLSRIYEQRLSPLYISVHATNDEVRRYMLGNDAAPRLLPLLKEIVSHGIVLHTQIVICPGINDGRILDRSIDDLLSLHPGVASIAIVPVGLTKHRQGLHPLRRISRSQAKYLIEKYRGKQYLLRKELKKTILYFSDEFYILSGLDIPEDIWYDDYPQLENGVGMVSKFLKELKHFSRWLPHKIQGRKKIVIITGLLAKPILESLRSILSNINGIEAEVMPIENNLFGSMVTVSGLLGTNDIIKKIHSNPGFDLVALPDNLLNQEDLFIDGVTRKEFECRISPSNAVFGLNELALAIKRWTR